MLQPHADADADADALSRVVAFLRQIGLTVRLVASVPSDSFMPGVRIRAGGLDVTPTAAVSDVLHEAGHLAVLPARFRSQAEDDVDAVIEGMLNTLMAEEEPDSPRMVAAIQAGENEATAWAWAAGQALGLPAEQIIQDEDYQHEGRVIRQLLALGQHAGINGLARGGFAVRRGLFTAPEAACYPQLNFWLQA